MTLSLSPFTVCVYKKVPAVGGHHPQQVHPFFYDHLSFFFLVGEYVEFLQ
jgi:hypothetical protein